MPPHARQVGSVPLLQKRVAQVVNSCPQPQINTWQAGMAMKLDHLICGHARVLVGRLSTFLVIKMAALAGADQTAMAN